jgi:putative transposase
MKRTYEYRLYPNKTQDNALRRLLEIHRTVYNDALYERREAWNRCHISVNYYTQANQLREARTIDPDLAFANYSSLQQTLRRLNKSFAAFFRRVKNGEKAGYPRFKPKNRFHSFEYTYNDGCRLQIEPKIRLYIQNVGAVRIKYHRSIPSDATINHVVIRRNVGHWYVYLMWEAPDVILSTHEGPEVGIDMGLHHLLALSDGIIIENPRWLKNELADLRVAQRRINRRKKSSRRRRKASFQVARRHKHISNRRKDFWHKTTRKLAETYSLIAIEDLNLAFMNRSNTLAQSSYDAALGVFKLLIAHKAEEAGAQLIKVNPRNTSQICSGCGTIVHKGLSVRIHNCPDCGLILDRDVNAARNILHLARTGPLGANADARRSCVV